MPPAMHGIGIDGHKAASEFAAAAKGGDRDKALALLPNLTTAAETSAREMAALETEIQRTGTRVLVVGVGANPSLAQRVARDHGLRVIQLYTGALSEPGGSAPTYLDLMRYNVSQLVEALTRKVP